MSTQAQHIARGYARNQEDEQRLIATGIKASSIYREDRGSEQWGKWNLRSGELLGVVDGLRALGDNRRDIMAAVREIHGWGAVLIDVENGMRSDRKGAEMLDEAMARIRGEKTMKSKKQARDMQAKSVRSRTKGRMPMREALVVWRNPILTVVEAIDEMPGWSMRTAYDKLGNRGIPPGRRSKKAE